MKINSQTISQLIQVRDCWLNPKYELRQQAIDKASIEFGLSKENFTLALDWIFSEWHEDNFLEMIKHCPFTGISNAIQILAGNTPAVIAQAFLQGVILQVPQIIKASSRCILFPQLIHQSFSSISKRLSQLFYLEHNHESANFKDKIKAADLVIAYGNDASIANIKKYLSSKTIFIGHGHAGSAAIILKEAANNDSLEKLAWDMLSYDQRGCLSPRVTFVQQGGQLQPAECAKLFASKILSKYALKLPRGCLFSGEAAAILQARSVYRFRGQVYEGSDWTVCFDEKLSWPEESLPRFMPFKSFISLQELKPLLKSMDNNLLSIGYSGNESYLKSIVSQPIKLFPLGKMQQQLLCW